MPRKHMAEAPFSGLPEILVAVPISVAARLQGGAAGREEALHAGGAAVDVDVGGGVARRGEGSLAGAPAVGVPEVGVVAWPPLRFGLSSNFGNSARQSTELCLGTATESKRMSTSLFWMKNPSVELGVNTDFGLSYIFYRNLKKIILCTGFNNIIY